jgi:RNA-directed DNA polymerase
MNEAKSYSITKELVMEAFQCVKVNKGSPGIDQVSIQQYEEKLEDNLYKLWNRMSSGCYFPKPYKIVMIPKSNGKLRQLSIPTVEDRIAQMVAKLTIEPTIDPIFHPDSYGYRPNKSAHLALATTRQRCWRYPWVIDLDIQGFFDNLDHELLMKAVKHYVKEKWVILYIERWIKTPVPNPDKTGSPTVPIKGIAQGGVISPLLANIFLHIALDSWMRKEFPQNPFERYADDMIIHTQTEEEAKSILEAISQRLQKCNLNLNQDKTKIVYCKQADRDKDYPHIQFDFLGYTFRPRGAKTKQGTMFLSFLPAISHKAIQQIQDKVRSWKIQTKALLPLEALAKYWNPIVRGWIQYYGKFYVSALHQVKEILDRMLIKWIRDKYKSVRSSLKRAYRLLQRMKNQNPTLFVHWSIK